MNIALLNTRIMLQKNTVVTDTIGNHKNAWTDYFSCAATLGGESGSEDFRAGETLEQQDLSFTIRYCSEVKALTTTDYRVFWNNQIYDILAIDHMNLKCKSLKIRCQRARR